MGGDLMDVRRRWEELGRDFAVAEGRDRVAVSVEMRQLEALLAAETAEVIDTGDPVEVARLLLRELAALCRADVEMARMVRAEVLRAIPLRGDE